MPAVFVFDKDGDLSVFPSLTAAEDYIEAPDVLAGEYPAVFLHDGTVLRPVVRGQRPVLEVTADHDPHALADWLGRYRRLVPSAPAANDPLDFANEWFRQEWEARWPRRPGWLSRWVHGTGPHPLPDA